MSQSPYPIILCGDFNETPQSYIYKLLSENFDDAFREGGWGIGSTYAGKIPGLKIDHILYPKEMKVLDARVSKVEFSDHYPVVGRLEWR